ncbi:MAG: putative lipid II flippase FtsW [Candidatus Accumulibacter sp.]|jgi:cell division protein FtsW|nr:putative lipid II flippase FtsW [Accumulibacter sp.]
MLPAVDVRRRPPAEIDGTLLWSALILLLLGTVMVYSASIAIAEASRYAGNYSGYFLVRHGVYAAIGLIFGLLAFQVPVQDWQKMSPWLFAAGLILLVLVLIPGVGRWVNGARRWLSLGVANVQPSELMKLFAVLYAADYTVRKMPDMRSPRKAFMPLAAAMMAVGALLLAEPDLGAFVVIVSIAFGIFFLGGMRLRLFAILAALLAVAFALVVVIEPYRIKRIQGFMDPWSNPFDKCCYQLTHSLMAFGRGELFGVGLGASVEKLFYLPEAHTDFLLAVIGEELGFAGVVSVIVLFCLLVQRAFAIGQQCVALDRLYPSLVAQGVGIWLGVQSIINMGSNMGLLPPKGLTLPLMGFGGSGLLANCLALAILLRIDWENRQLMRGAKL